MSVLPDHEIERLCLDPGGRPEMVIPFDEKQLHAASYDVRLATNLMLPHVRTLLDKVDLRKPSTRVMEEIEIDQEFELRPLHFVLASTVEWVNIPSYVVGRIEGKSTNARVGVQIHSAGYLDPGFSGNVTLELVNFWPAPVVLWPHMLIGQLSFEYLTSECREPYGRRNHYQQSEGVVGARFD